MRPVTVSVTVTQGREEVYDFLDVMANHEPFTDHMLRDWEYSGPASGVGAKATVQVRAAGRTDAVEIEVVEAVRPVRIVERNTGAGGRRVAHGTYELEELPGGGTRIAFEYAWRRVPPAERLSAPLVRSLLRRGNERALRRLAARLSAGGGQPAP
ncbi:SRPBCC family protein [Streptomyces ovatisporus]|uniref:SRPBCC family protein n=1 Tax=Streptomyces ovatisporus TaxID=1128682 RepID=A0ABV8ZZA0_9ACTN